ncbi:MAG: type II toxin-antitoxin system YafQ family toxin [Prevotella sp.]|nr:type II toxin-antitoxin system YafQ family toxin [Prevotella sp.]
MYSIDTTKRFDKDLKLCLKRGLNIQLVYDAITILRSTGSLPAQYHPHKLSGNLDGIWECHIKPDWLMTWEQSDTQLTLLFLRTGSHSDLF